MAEVIVVVEDRADAEIATKLAERVLLETVNWLEPELISNFIQWRGFQEQTPFSTWKTDVKKAEQIAQAVGLTMPRSRGHTPDGPLQPDGAAARKAIILTQLLQRKQPEIKAILLIRDLDNQPDRRRGLEQARKANSKDLSLQIILGTADPKREAWVLNGFITQSKIEEKICLEIFKKLNFDPCQEAHRLRSPNASPDQSRNIKSVLDKLTQETYDREKRCWEETDLKMLEQRGENTGLTEYLKEVKDKLPHVI